MVEELAEEVEFGGGGVGRGVEEVADGDFEFFDGHAGLQGEEVASGGDFDEGEPGDAAEEAVVGDDEEGFVGRDGEFADGGGRGAGAAEGGFGGLDDGFGAVGVDFGEAVEDAEGEGDSDRTGGFAEFGGAPAFVGAVFGVVHVVVCPVLGRRAWRGQKIDRIYIAQREPLVARQFARRGRGVRGPPRTRREGEKRKVGKRAFWGLPSGRGDGMVPAVFYVKTHQRKQTQTLCRRSINW